MGRAAHHDWSRELHERARPDRRRGQRVCRYPGAIGADCNRGCRQPRSRFYPCRPHRCSANQQRSSLANCPRRASRKNSRRRYATRCASFGTARRSGRVARRSPASGFRAVRRFRTWYWAGLVTVLLAIALIAVARGAVAVSIAAVLDALRGRGDPTAVAIVRDLRLPRVLLGALVGAGLGASGAALQGALRNALAEPYLLGVSGGAAVGAVVAFALGAAGDVTITLAAFVGGVGAGVLPLR